jgi:hypothetical protein
MGAEKFTAIHNSISRADNCPVPCARAKLSDLTGQIVGYGVTPTSKTERGNPCVRDIVNRSMVGIVATRDSGDPSERRAA